MRKRIVAFIFLCTYLSVSIAKRLSTHELFLKGLNASCIKKYHDIRSNGTLTKRQYKTELQKFISNLPVENQDLYKRIDEANEKKINRQKAHFMKKIQNLSSEVKSIATQIMAIRDDLDITRAQEKEKLQQLRAGLPKEVRKEIKKLFPAEKHRQRGKVSRKHQNKQSP